MGTYVNADWIEEKLQELQADAEEIYKVAPNESNPFQSWSAIKLILHVATVEVYTRIIPNHFANLYYVDLMAGSGSVTLEGDDYLVGSPILAPAIAHEQFDHLYLVEMDDDRATALDERLKSVADNLSYGLDRDQFDVIQGDANKKIAEITESIKKDSVYKSVSAHSLVFADNEGLDITWSTMQKVTNIYSDLLINFPTLNVKRQVGARNEETLDNFYGNSRWKAAHLDGDELRGIYKGNITTLERPIQRHVKVKGDKSFNYDMIYASYETKHGCPYIEAYEYMKKRLEQISGNDIRKVLGKMKGKRVGLDLFPEDDDDQEQTGLGQFDDD